jgi:hypothetical protein
MREIEVNQTVKLAGTTTLMTRSDTALVVAAITAALCYKQ